MIGNDGIRSFGAIALTLIEWATCLAAPPQEASDPPTGEAALQAASLDAASASRSYRVRRWIRRRVVFERDLAKYGLQLDDGWQSAAVERSIVVLIHGFNSTPERTGGLIEPAREAKYPCGTFAYPNDDTLPVSAELLSRELHEFSDAYPGRRVALVCHSMGGLVARWCVEDPELDPGNVDRLIMVAPPTHGSQLARFAVGTDVWEHWLARKNGWPWTRTHDSIVDGLGEAGDELVPDSEFLAELNARPRNPHVQYSILLGTSAVVSQAELAWIRKTVCEKLERLPGMAGRAERLEAALADIDELVDGKGDGVVAVKRGRLAGVEDTLVMPFNHLAVGGESDDRELRAVYEAVLERLQ